MARDLVRLLATLFNLPGWFLIWSILKSHPHDFSILTQISQNFILIKVKYVEKGIKEFWILKNIKSAWFDSSCSRFSLIGSVHIYDF